MNSKLLNILKCYVIVLFSISLFVFSFYMGWINKIWNEDTTKLSFVIMAIGFYYLISGLLLASSADEEFVESGMNGAENCAKLGLVGTVIGFIMAMASVIGLDFKDQTTFQTVLSSMMGGVSIALYTTLVGQIFNILITTLYMIIGHTLNKETENE